jgi:hypothetical protein
MTLQLSATRQAGLSLVELMIALVIGVVLTFGAVNLFLQGKRSFYQDEETARLQENGRYALRLLSRELTMGGFLGGLMDGASINSAALTGADCEVDWAVDSARGLQHLDSIDPDNPADPANPDGVFAGCPSLLDFADVIAGTDVLGVRRVKDAARYRQGEPASPGLENDRVFLVLTDYGVGKQLLKGSDISLSANMDIWEYYPQLYFIRNFSVTAGDAIPTLCRRQLSTTGAVDLGNVECLIEGIEDLQVEWGVDTDNPPDYMPDIYLPNPSEAQVAQATVARIYLLARSVNEVAGYSNDKTYYLGSKSFTAPGDGFYRRAMQTSVQLRNSDALGF